MQTEKPALLGLDLPDRPRRPQQKSAVRNPWFHPEGGWFQDQGSSFFLDSTTRLCQGQNLLSLRDRPLCGRRRRRRRKLSIPTPYEATPVFRPNSSIRTRTIPKAQLPNESLGQAKHAYHTPSCIAGCCAFLGRGAAGLLEDYCLLARASPQPFGASLGKPTCRWLFSLNTMGGPLVFLDPSR